MCHVLTSLLVPHWKANKLKDVDKHSIHFSLCRWKERRREFSTHARAPVPSRSGPGRGEAAGDLGEIRDFSLRVMGVFIFGPHGNCFCN